MSRAEQAAKDFLSGYSCAQAVVMAFAREYGMSREDAARIATALGGGMAHMCLTCGAVTGALLVIGLARGGEPGTKPEVYLRAQEFMRAFGGEHGSINCRELIGYDLGIPAQVDEARGRGVFQTHCRGYVEAAVRILEDMLRD